MPDRSQVLKGDQSCSSQRLRANHLYTHDDHTIVRGAGGKIRVRIIDLRETLVKHIEAKQSDFVFEGFIYAITQARLARSCSSRNSNTNWFRLSRFTCDTGSKLGLVCALDGQALVGSVVAGG